MELVMSPCQSEVKQSIHSKSILARRKTEDWLRNVMEDKSINFRYFITLTFYKAQTNLINQYLDNKHIKKVILDFFYPNKKPNNRVRVWFFVERHQEGTLHLHLLMEGLDGLTWLMTNNRKISLSKNTLFDIVADDYSMDDVITEALTNHLQTYILRLGKSQQSVDCRSIGNIQKRVHYVNKQLGSINFDAWEHIDFENSDL
tara:strand:+ start:1503 stop:2108 length:606 start_codon:yes stop_codon:yes gene_type:complete